MPLLGKLDEAILEIAEIAMRELYRRFGVNPAAMMFLPGLAAYILGFVASLHLGVVSDSFFILPAGSFAYLTTQHWKKCADMRADMRREWDWAAYRRYAPMAELRRHLSDFRFARLSMGVLTLVIPASCIGSGTSTMEIADYIGVSASVMGTFIFGYVVSAKPPEPFSGQGVFEGRVAF